MLTPDDALAAFQAHGSWRAAAAALQCDPGTVKRYAQRADPTIPHDARPHRVHASHRPRLVLPEASPPLVLPATVAAKAEPAPGLELPEFPDADLPIDEILDTKARLFDLKKARRKAERYFEVRVPEQGAFGLLVLGDPHLDDDGCDVRLMRHHLEIGRQPGVYTTSVGDMTNNWPHSGRLARLYASQSTDYHRGIRLLKWLLLDAGVTWPFLATGNHDDWNSGQEILREIVGKRFPVLDWDARVEIAAGSRRWRIHMAHNFPGHSMWHNLHAMLRASRFTTDAELLIAGHLHTESYMRFGMPGVGRYVHAVRVRGYKAHDHYADRLGYQTDPDGASALIIMGHDHGENNARFLVYHDIDVGYRVLQSLRQHQRTVSHDRARPAVASARQEAAQARSEAPQRGAARADVAARDRARRADGQRQVDGGGGPRQAGRVRDPALRRAAEADAGSARRAGAKPVRKPAREIGAPGPAWRP